MRDGKRANERGQTAVLVALLMAGLLVGTGLAIDGGTTFIERRRMQNAADAAALAGAQQVASYRTGNEIHDSDVAQAVNRLSEANGVKDTNDNLSDEINDNVVAVYVDEDNNVLGAVGDGLPDEATGVMVDVKIQRSARLMQLVGMRAIPASAASLAQTGLFDGGVSGDPVPHALSHVTFEPDWGECDDCVIEGPPGYEWDEDEEQEEIPIDIPRDTGDLIPYEFTNWGDRIKFDVVDRDDEVGLGEDRECANDTFTIVVSDEPVGFNFETFAAGSSDRQGYSLDELVNPVQMENTGFWIEFADVDEDGTAFTFKVYSCMDAAVQSDPSAATVQ